MLRSTRSYQTVRHMRLLLGSEYRVRNRSAAADFRGFCREDGGRALRHDLLPRGRKPKTALVVSQYYLPFAKLEALVMKGFHIAGFRTIVLGNRRYDFMRYGWLAGNRRVLDFADFATPGDPEWVARHAAQATTQQEWLRLEYQGVHVGRIVIATMLRSLRVGKLDYDDPAIQAKLRAALQKSVELTRSGARLLRAVKPDLVLLMDRGYSGYGEIFDLAIRQGIDSVTWHVGYKSNRLVFKRYNTGNERDHPLSPSAESWRRLRSMPWKTDYGRSVREELFQCYQTQDWFSVVGTQFDKRIMSKEETRRKLGLSSDKKVAVIFPHILWDGSFFFGHDLFDDYTHWFAQTVRAAVANPRLQWVVKLHPAHLVKARQQNATGSPAELEVIDAAVGDLPAHVTLVHPETDLSTYSLFEIADYAITVRGTVGIEAALFGIAVVTAGTGRYDRRGFTLDSSTQGEYLDKLHALERYPRLSPAQVELAERYACGTFLWRQLALSSASVDYKRDGKATPRLTVRCQTRREWMESPDLQQLSAWFANGQAADMLCVPS